jgi:hypothetical protein
MNIYAILRGKQAQFEVTIIEIRPALLGALLRAREGYENENGFHIRARRKQARRPRHVQAEDKPASHKGIFTATISNFRERKFAWLEREKSTL